MCISRFSCHIYTFTASCTTHRRYCQNDPYYFGFIVCLSESISSRIIIIMINNVLIAWKTKTISAHTLEHERTYKTTVWRPLSHNVARTMKMEMYTTQTHYACDARDGVLINVCHTMNKPVKSVFTVPKHSVHTPQPVSVSSLTLSLPEFSSYLKDLAL